MTAERTPEAEESEQSWGIVYSFSGGLISRAENYYDRRDALASLGLTARH